MRLGFIFKEVGQGLRRNLSMVVSVVLVTLVSLSFVGTAMLLQMQIASMKTYWYDRAQVAVYLCTDTSPASTCPQGEANDNQKAAVEAQLKGETLSTYIDKYFFEDHEQAYENFQVQFKGNAIAKYVTPEQLNETFWVKLKNPEDSAIITESFGGTAGVEEVRDQRTYLDQIFAILNAASITAISIAALMLFSATLLISTTIRLSAFSRRREIAIMRLVGASNFYIQLPFILEGVVAALIGSLFAGATITAIVHFFVQGFLANAMPFTNLVGLGEALIVAPIIVIFGVALAAVASAVAMRRYLKI